MTTAPTRSVTTDATDTDWRAHAACATVDADLFFPVPHTADWKKNTKAAKAVCARCPAKEACLDWALDTAQPAGIWGGLTVLERRRRRGSRESQMRRCQERRAWIEGQLAANVSQMAIASRLRVTRQTLARAVAQFKEERATTAAEGVKAA
jgi:WhiB family redox-sensing transcriptional regulator